MNKKIAGGVTPLKLRAGNAKSRRGGKQAGKATAKKGNYLGGRGGYDKASGKQGTGTNRGGYNIHTRFKPRAVPGGPKGGGGGSTKEPTDNKPYSFDKNGNIVIHNNNYIDTKGGTQTLTNNVKTEDKKIDDNNKLLSGEEYKQEDGVTTTKTVKTDKDGNVVKPEDRVCNPAYPAAHGGKGGPGSPECLAYEKHREDNPVDRSERKSGTVTTTTGGKKMKRTWTQVPPADRVYSPWEPA